MAIGCGVTPIVSQTSFITALLWRRHHKGLNWQCLTDTYSFVIVYTISLYNGVSSRKRGVTSVSWKQVLPTKDGEQTPKPIFQGGALITHIIHTKTEKICFLSFSIKWVTSGNSLILKTKSILSVVCRFRQLVSCFPTFSKKNTRQLAFAWSFVTDEPSVI